MAQLISHWCKSLGQISINKEIEEVDQFTQLVHSSLLLKNLCQPELGLSIFQDKRPISRTSTALDQQTSRVMVFSHADVQRSTSVGLVHLDTSWLVSPLGTLTGWYELRQYQASSSTILVRTWGYTSLVLLSMPSIYLSHTSQKSILDSIWRPGSYGNFRRYLPNTRSRLLHSKVDTRPPLVQILISSNGLWEADSVRMNVLFSFCCKPLSSHWCSSCFYNIQGVSFGSLRVWGGNLCPHYVT